MSTEMPQPTRDELAGLYGEDLVGLCEAAAGNGHCRDPYGFGRDATLWERVYLNDAGIHGEWRSAYARATARGECPIRELPDWARESWSADDICSSFPCPACPTSPTEEITGMAPEEYLEWMRTPSEDDDLYDDLPI